MMYVEDMDRHLVGSKVSEDPDMVLQQKNVAVPINNLYEKKFIGIEGMVKIEVVVYCTGISQEHKDWCWNSLNLGPVEGLCALVFGRYENGKRVPILKYHDMNISSIEKTDSGFSFRADTLRDYA